METQKIFFSYSRLDSPFALKLARDLREAGADIWIDQLDIQAGSHWDSAVEKALNSAACVLVIISPFSTTSTNVMDEVSFALETGKKIIPVMLEECPPPFRLRRLQRIDFTTDYNTGLTQLFLSLNLVSSLSKKPKDLVPANGIPGDDPEMEMTADEAEDHMLWDDACRLNTIESYEKYMIRSALGTFKNEAKLMIKQLELEEKEDELESLVWEKTQAEHSVQLYQHYLEEYPDGDYKTLALAAIAELENHDKLDVGKKTTQPEVKVAPAHGVRVKGNRIIFISLGLVAVGLLSAGFATVNAEKKQESKAWQLASAKKDSISYSAYLLAYPNGRHMKEAKQWLDSLAAKQTLAIDTATTLVVNQPVATDTTKVIATPANDSIKSVSPAPKPKSTAPAKPAAKFVIGQRHAGGIIAYVNSTGAHGLIMAEKDLGGYDWDTAKKKCDGSKAGAIYDWRMPTKDELQKMYNARHKAGGFAKGMYWSSTQAGNDMIWTMNLKDGTSGKFSKKMTWFIRPVRTF
jgi:hypothetical protein